LKLNTDGGYLKDETKTIEPGYSDKELKIVANLENLTAKYNVKLKLPTSLEISGLPENNIVAVGQEIEMAIKILSDKEDITDKVEYKCEPYIDINNVISITPPCKIKTEKEGEITVEIKSEKHRSLCEEYDCNQFKFEVGDEKTIIAKRKKAEADKIAAEKRAKKCTSCVEKCEKRVKAKYDKKEMDCDGFFSCFGEGISEGLSQANEEEACTTKKCKKYCEAK
jgi:hypothetical protein